MEIKDKDENLIGEVNPETDEYSYIGVIFVCKVNILFMFVSW